MKSTPAYICFSFLIFLTLADCSKKENGSTRIEFEALSGNLVLITGGGTNVIASAGKDGLLLVDTKLPEFTETIVKELTGDNPGKTLLVIDTHCHSDHVSGNKSWRERGALIAAHENTLIHLETGSYSPFWDERTPPAETGALPSLSFQESITLHFNGDEVAVSHLTGHTDGDVTVYFRNANVMHLGDIVFSGFFPNSDLVDGGSIDLQILAVKQILTIIDEETAVIAGHGPPMTRKDLEKCHDMMTDIRDQIGRQVQMGRTLDQVIASRPTSAYENDWEYGSLTRDRYIELIYRHILAAEKQ